MGSIYFERVGWGGLRGPTRPIAAKRAGGGSEKNQLGLKSGARQCARRHKVCVSLITQHQSLLPLPLEQSVTRNDRRLVGRRDPCRLLLSDQALTSLARAATVPTFRSDLLSTRSGDRFL